MKEIKLVEVDATYGTELKDGIKLKTFYTIAEMTAIINDMKEKDNALARLFSKVVLTARLNTNIDWADFTDNEVFDACAELGLIDEFESAVPMFYELDSIIRADESTYRLLEGFINSFGAKLDGFDITKIQDGFSGLKEVIK